MKLAQTRPVLLIGITIISLLLIFDPLQLFVPQAAPQLQAIDPAMLEEHSRSLVADARPAQEASLGLFDRSSLVLAGDSMLVREEAEFIRDLLPRLSEKQVHILAVDFLLSADQAAIDSLLADSRWDENRARDLLIRRNPFYAFRQYLEIIKAAHSVARKDPEFRLLGLNLAFDTKAAELASAEPLAENFRKVFPNGLPEEHMARVLKQEVLEAGKRALVFAMREATITGFDDPDYANQIKSLGLGDPRHMGRILFQAYPDRVAGIWFHSPWSTAGQVFPFTYPASGVVDNTLRHLGEERSPSFPFAIDLRQSRLGSYLVQDSDFIVTRPFSWQETNTSTGERIERNSVPDFLGPMELRNFTFIYIVLDRLNRLHAYDAIPDLVNAGNLLTVQGFIPINSPERNNLEKLNSTNVRHQNEIQEKLQKFAY